MIKFKKCVIYTFYIMVMIYIYVYIYPIIFNLYNSLIGHNGITFINYSKLFIDKQFVLAMNNLFSFASISILITIILGYYIAVKFIRRNNTFSVLKGAFFLPMLLPSSAIIFTWEKIFQKENWLSKYLFESRGLGNDWSDLIPLIMMFIWKNVGACIIIFLAGFMTIPDEVYDAGELDGTNKFQRFKYITLPLMLTTIYISIMYLFIQSLRIGRESILLHGKYPKESQYMISNYFNNNFEQMNIGVLTSSGIVISLLVVVMVSILYLHKTYLEGK